MAYAEMFEIPADWATYEKVSNELGENRPGLIVHAAGPSAAGVRIVNVWESREAKERFSALLEAARNRVGLGPIDALQVDDFDVQHVFKG